MSAASSVTNTRDKSVRSGTPLTFVLLTEIQSVNQFEIESALWLYDTMQGWKKYSSIEADSNILVS